VVDLHLHTTISDGRLSPAELVDRAVAGGVTVMAVTDHDTTLGTGEVAALAAARGIEAVSGIEITAVEDAKDVHILGYFVRPDDGELALFLTEQRVRRIERLRAIADRLAGLDMPVDLEPLLAEARLTPGRSLGRPQVARAMIGAGYVATMAEAFDRWLAHGRPGFVPRMGPSCEAVIEIIHHAGGLASLAHPGRTDIDARIPALCRAGLDALEVHHSDHDGPLVERYLLMSLAAGVLVTGGSDFHGDPQQRRSPGSCVLPEPDWHRLKSAAASHA
jgi:predicted metal-dependent phosphoesterase TrpH